jgi:hypothetical protein
MTAHATSPTPASVAARVAAIPHLSMDDLWALWDDHFEERPHHHHRVWLESRLAYRMQERAFGSLKPSLCPYRLNFDQVYRLKFDQA